MKYPEVRELEIGESTAITRPLHPNGAIDERANFNIIRSINHIQKQYGRKFIRGGNPATLYVTRIT